MNLRPQGSSLALSLALAVLAAPVLPNGPTGYREADAQQARPQSRRLTAGRSARARPTAPANNAINAATRSARASRNQSAAATPGGSGTPSGWRQNAPRLPADPQRSIAQGTQLRATPPPMPPQLPGTLRLSRHLTRESVSPYPVGNVVPTVPLTPEQRLRSRQEPSGVRSVQGPGLNPAANPDHRGIAPSANPAQAPR